MTVHEIYAIVDSLQKQRKDLSPLTAEVEAKLWEKYRLDWDYNSNHLEGNTLSYMHTRMLLIFDEIPSGYTKREIDEMEAHDVAVGMILQLAKDPDRDITEVFIRQLNEIILVKPFFKDAVTPEGQPTRKRIEPGVYKSEPNHVKLQNGEIFRYATPEETPAQMAELLQFYRSNMVSTDVHPLWLAAMLHYKFVRIHPFDDGNGRISRLLMNFVLLKKGFPPVVIKSEDKKGYLKALRQADAGDLESFVIYVGQQLQWSLDLNIRAAKGEDIDDPDDLVKSIEILKKKLGPDMASTEGSNRVIYEILRDSIGPVLTAFEEAGEKLADLFGAVERNINYSTANGRYNIASGNLPKQTIEDLLNAASVQKITELDYNYYLRGFKKSLTHQYMSSAIKINFHEYIYTVIINSQHDSTRHFSYDKQLTKEEIQGLVKAMMEPILAQIKRAGGIK